MITADDSTQEACIYWRGIAKQTTSVFFSSWFSVLYGSLVLTCGSGEPKFPWASRHWAESKGALSAPRGTPRIGDFVLFVCSRFIVTHWNSLWLTTIIRESNEQPSYMSLWVNRFMGCRYTCLLDSLCCR